MADQQNKTAVVKKRKQRRSYNCGPCKRQKIKCDTAIPCGACVRHNRVDQCLAAPPNPPVENDKKKTRTDVGDNGVNLGEKQSEIRLPSIKAYTSTFKITGQIQPQQVLIPSNGAINPVGIPWENRAQTDLGKYTYNNNNTNEINNNNTTEVLELRKEVKSLHERLALLESKLSARNASSNEQLPSNGDSSKSFNHHHIQHSSPGQQFIEFIKKLPSIRSLEKLLSFYKSSLNSILEIFDDKLIDSSLEALTSFTDSLNQHHVSSHPSVTSHQWNSLSVISMITSLSIVQYPPNYLEQHTNIKLESVLSYSNTLFQISKSSLNAVKYRESPKIIHLKILLLFDKYLHLFTKKSLMLALDSELVSMSYVMGLQTLAIPQNSLEIEQSQKVWWIICHYDALKALRFQMPPLIRLDTLSTNGLGENGGKNTGTSHILKAFISAENTSYQSIITHIAKITKICNEIPTSIRHSMVEYLESMIILDRKLTTYQVPVAFLINPANDASVNFQSCYLHFFITINRFMIYKKIYFTNEQLSDQNLDGFINQSIWFIMLSIVESFLKKYSELRELYPLKDLKNTSQYVQLAEFLVTGAIVHLIMEISPNSRLHPQGYKNIMKEYSSMLLEDLQFLRENAVFNESLPFYNQTFTTLDKLLEFQTKQENELNSSAYYESFEVKQKRLQLSNELQSSKVLESDESNTGLIPSNEFFNQYLGSIVHLSRNNYNFQPPQYNNQQQQQITQNQAFGAITLHTNNSSHTANNKDRGVGSTPGEAGVDNWGLSEVLGQDQLKFLNYLGL